MKSQPSRVLVVDCNVDAAELLGILLRGHGFEVQVECDKAAALATAETFLPDSVIIDLGKDNMDTYELAAALRDIPTLQNAYLITLSAAGLPKPYQAAEFKIDMHLAKPSGYRMLIDVLKRHFAGM
jgi:CheY-like chemotaxis protein